MTADLHAASLALVADTCPLARVRELAATGGGLGRDERAAAAALGWFSFALDDPVDGPGGLDGAVAVAGARGRTLHPGPFVETNVVATALAGDGPAAVVGALRSGEATATWAATDEVGTWDGGAGLALRRRGGTVVLDGTRGLVHDAQRVEWVLAVATTDDGAPAQVLVPAGTAGVVVEPLAGLDLTRTLCTVRFAGAELDGTAVLRPGDRGADVERGLQLAVVLALAETLGATGELFDRTVAYARERRAFGRPIGSFQAVKHLLADASLRLEMAQALAADATAAVRDRRADAPEAVSAAKAFTGDAGTELAHACWQVFGGVAYTWDHDFHLYLRRLAADAARFGSPAWHRERICRLHGI